MPLYLRRRAEHFHEDHAARPGRARHEPRRLTPDPGLVVQALLAASAVRAADRAARIAGLAATKVLHL